MPSLNICIQSPNCELPSYLYPSAFAFFLLRLTSTIPVWLARVSNAPAGVGRIRFDNMALRPLPLNGTDRIPAELMAQILDNTKRNTQSLHACCLVCVAWHSYLVDSLYKTIRLESRSRVDRLARTALIYPAVRGRLALARSVILGNANWRAQGFAHVFPLVLGPRLHKLHDLTLRNCLGQLLHPNFFLKLRQLTDVKHLVLSGSPPQKFADFQRIVRAFPQLEELDIAELTESSWNASQLTPPHVLNRPCIPKLTCVRVSDRVPEFFRDLVAWLSSSGVCSTIRRLDISVDSRLSEAEPLHALLALTASTLEHLRMFIFIESTHSLLHADSRCHIACRRIG